MQSSVKFKTENLPLVGIWDSENTFRFLKPPIFLLVVFLTNIKHLCTGDAVVGVQFCQVSSHEIDSHRFTSSDVSGQPR